MQFRVHRKTLIGDICWADPYGDNWGWFSETTRLATITDLNFCMILRYIVPIANIMKMRKMFYFYISLDSRVKIDCFLNNIVVIAQEILVLS